MKAREGKLRAGFHLHVSHLERDDAGALVARGAHWAASSAQAAAHSDVIGICVAGDDSVRDVVTKKAGVLSRATPGSLLLIHSTVLPETIERLSRAALEAAL